MPKTIRDASSVPASGHILAHRAKIQALDTTYVFDDFLLTGKRLIGRTVPRLTSRLQLDRQMRARAYHENVSYGELYLIDLFDTE